MVASSFLIGLLLGGVISLLREYFASTIRTRQEFEQTLEIPFLGHIPIIPKDPQGHVPQQILLDEPTSPAAEAIRSVRTTLEFILSAGTCHCLVVTSALPEEGKSLICTNLAIALNELNRKVLVVDADLRRPTLHRTFGVELEPGLSSYLQEALNVEGIVRPVPNVEGLSLVTAGPSPPQPTDLLNHPRFRELLKQWRQQFDYILLDSPPVLVASDSAVLATLADGTLYIVRANRTHVEPALVGKQRLVDVGAKIIGGILNGARLEFERGYRYYYSYRYYRGGPKRSQRIPPPSPEIQEPTQEA